MSNIYMISVLVLFTIVKCSSGVPLDQFYSFGEYAGDRKIVAKDEGATNEVELKSPFVYYGETYFSLFININGLISFLTEIPYFFNAQFPLDYPVIAPFYSDVDTSGTGNIWFRETSDPATISRISSDLRKYFESAAQFQPQSVFITTWDAVGAFQGRRDKVNTFQVVMTTDSRDSFIIFYYADGGLQWLQGDGKTSGLPDALGQAGFIAADGRLFTIKGSGTDQVRNLDRWSNVGEPGVWMFRVGRILPGKNIQPPNLIEGFPNIKGVETYNEKFTEGEGSCASGGSLCHSSASCIDYPEGFCCQCKEEFYGNGINCLKKETPIRVTGKMNGNVNGIDITDADLHSYVLSTEGRTYTAVSRIPKEVGYDLQSLTGIGEGIAWLFAVPKEGVSNGFTLTGGTLNRTVEVTFPQTGHKALVEQIFEGLDVFNNVALTTKISGSIPTVPVGSELEVDAFNEEFTRVKAGQLRARSARSFKLKGKSLDTPYTVETFINFDECENTPRELHHDTLRMKVAENIFIRFDEAEAIVRYSFSAKTGTLEEEDPCIKGREECGDNSLCIVDGDGYRCVCEQGYDYIFDASLNIPVCLDINECDLGRDVCDGNAVCINSPGSYSCRCRTGYAGDGYYCNPKITCNNAGCDPNASCTEVAGQPECDCNIGYKGDGFFCSPDFGDDSCHIAQNCSPYAVCAPTAKEYACRCLQGYVGDGYTCEVDRLIPFYPHGQGEYKPLDPGYPEQASTQRPLDPFPPVDNNYNEQHIPETLEPSCSTRTCWCPPEYDHDVEIGICLLKKEDSQKAYDFGFPLPICFEGTCFCPIGYEYQPKDQACSPSGPPGYDYSIKGGVTSCNILNNCHPDAQCLYLGLSRESNCICNAGFSGDGLFCTPLSNLELSCDQIDNCHLNADCVFDDVQLTSVCVCKPGHAGDGFVCTPKDDCNSSQDCDVNAQCQFDSVGQRYTCQCNLAFKGDGFACIPIEDNICITLNNCNENADCIYDASEARYQCKCRQGFEGDGYSCTQIEVGCSVMNNCGLNAECAFDSNTRSFHCRCLEGFDGDGFYCRAVRSCSNDPSVCHPHATCERNPADEFRHMCVCLPGFIGDGENCQKAPDHEKEILLINQGLSVLRMPVNRKLGIGFPIHVDPYMTAVGADVDCLTGTYYWTDVGSRSIRSSKYDGTDRKPVVSGGQIGSPEDVAVDWLSQNIYWTDSVKDVVAVANIAGTLIKTVIEGDLVNPRGITLHPGFGLLFWSDWNRDNPKIEKSSLDGSERKILVSGTGVILPNSLVIDFETSNLCWADAGAHHIECIGVQGFGRRVIIKGIKYPFGLTLHNRNFYYTDWDDGRIHEVDSYSGEEHKTRSPPLGGSGKLYGIVAVPERCPSVSNVCQSGRGGCPDTHLCLPNVNGGRTCACPDGSDSQQCSDYQY